MVTCYDRGLFTSSDLYAPPQHVVPSHAAGVASEGILSPLGGRFMQDPASELRRIPLPRTPVNRVRKAGTAPALTVTTQKPLWRGCYSLSPHLRGAGDMDSFSSFESTGAKQPR